MYHLAAYKAAIDNTVNADVAALSDSVLSISNNHFRLVDPAQLVQAYAGSATLTRARLDSPSLRLMGNPYILPANAGVTPGDFPKIADWRRYPLHLPQREEIAMQAASAVAMGTETFFGLIWCQFTMQPIPAGRVQWVRATSTTAAVSGSWTNLALTFESALPTGTWCMVGSKHQSTNAVAHRVLFPGQLYRPGHLSCTTETRRDWFSNYDGTLGEMGRFVNDNVFQVEALVNGTDNAHVFYFGLVQVGSL